MIKEIAEKKTVTIKDTTSYNNGVKVVPTMLLQPVLIDKSNAKQTLLDAKYYTEARCSNPTRHDGSSTDEWLGVGTTAAPSRSVTT
jgi:hypothetical protein